MQNKKKFEKKRGGMYTTVAGSLAIDLVYGVWRLQIPWED
jgi:hypothetical protein